MFSKTTNTIKISVETEYDYMNSFPSDNRFVFKYYISIQNLGKEPVRLLKRKWQIYDVGFGFTDIFGDGVIGVIPEILPGEAFTYFSNVRLRSGVGHMKGRYFLENIISNENFEAEIPKFNLLSEVLSN